MSERTPNEPELPASMQTRMMPIGDVKRYTSNPRKKQNVEKVARSLEEFGWRMPIAVDGELVIIAGDTRYLAAHSLGMTHVPVWVAADLTEAQVHAYRLADNRLAEDAEWDTDLLRGELELLQSMGVEDLSLLTAFDEKELERILSGATDDVVLEPVDVAAFPPHTWVLIGIPTQRFIEIAEDVERITNTAGVFCEITANNDAPPKARAKT